jgi:serine/threonine protein kinase
MEGLLGKTLDNTYRVDALLGRGGMGAVYRARDTVLYRDVAIKVMHPHLTDDPDFQARFLQEARAIAALEHPGIVQVHACRQDQGLLYIVMDYIRGQTLQTWLRRFAQERKIVLLPESLAIIRQVALALHYAHQKGVLHRDIKPANIMLKPTDPMLRLPDELAFRPVLTDFGLAKLAAGIALTRTGTSMGTPAYMSPEQCLGLALDGRSDIYSIGIVLFELTVGRVPFQVGSLSHPFAYSGAPPASALRQPVPSCRRGRDYLARPRQKPGRALPDGL